MTSKRWNKCHLFSLGEITGNCSTPVQYHLSIDFYVQTTVEMFCSTCDMFFKEVLPN